MRECPKPGTVVRKKFGETFLDGVVMYYEMEWNSGIFPVRFSDGIWRLMVPSLVEEVPPLTGGKP
jgi:hypothetical protein